MRLETHISVSNELSTVLDQPDERIFRSEGEGHKKHKWRDGSRKNSGSLTYSIP